MKSSVIYAATCATIAYTDSLGKFGSGASDNTYYIILIVIQLNTCDLEEKNIEMRICRV